MGACALAPVVAAAPASASLTVAQIAPMSGPIGEEGKAYNLGIRVAIDALNARGGLHGQKVVLNTLDDEYKPDLTVELIRKEAAGKALALLLPVGSPSMSRVLKDKVIESVRMPIIGVIPGAEPLRNPLNPYVFHVRAGDHDQYRRIVEHALTIGMKRVAVVYADIPFGKAGLAEVERLLKAGGRELAASAPFPIGASIDFSAALAALRQAVPDVVVLISPAQPAGQFVKQYRAAGIASPVMTLSYGAAEAICRIAGNEMARGIGIAQVFPNASSPTVPVSRRFQEDFQRFAGTGGLPTQSHFEGYVTTQVLIEGLRRSGAAPTREKLIQALESMRETDIGGFMVDFSATRRTGSRFVDIGIISNNCKLVF
jgi:ABC-type branched-subunit amino acid transport system substrate-binding protein